MEEGGSREREKEGGRKGGREGGRERRKGKKEEGGREESQQNNLRRTPREARDGENTQEVKDGIKEQVEIGDAGCNPHNRENP
eukprot:763390-Hanusia_phi.AAC.4